MLCKRLAFIPFLFVILQCAGIEVFETVNPSIYRSSAGSSTILLGHFKVNGRKYNDSDVLRSALSFHLLRLGYRIADLNDYSDLLSDRGLQSSRQLSHRELQLLAGSVKERFLIQGFLYEEQRFELPEDRIDLTLAISVYDTRTARTASEYRLFMSDTDLHSSLSLFKLSRKFAETFHSTNTGYTR